MLQWAVIEIRMEDWALVDKQLCGLVDRLRAMGYRRTLEVELQFVEIGGDPWEYDFTMIFSEFREKGVVIIVDTNDGDRVLYSSAHSH